MNRNLNLGFTLIELIVVMAITSLIFGIGIVRYREFNETQRIKSAAADFRNNLREIQTKAVAGVKPSTGCTSLLGYEVRQAAPGTYGALAYCSDAGGSLVEPVFQYQLPSGIEFSQPFPSFRFLSLYQGTNIASVMTVKNVKTSVCYGISVSTGGDIVDQGKVICP